MEGDLNPPDPVDQNLDYVNSTSILPGEAYEIANLPDGDYLLQFASEALRGEWYDDVVDPSAAALITIVDGVAVTGIDAELGIGGTISGTVSTPSDPDAWVSVTLYRKTNTGDGWPYQDRVEVDWWSELAGDYRFTGLDDGEYFIKFSATTLVDEWYDDVIDWTAARAITIADGQTTTGIDGELEPGASISGTVTVPGQPDAEVWVNVEQVTRPDGDRIDLNPMGGTNVQAGSAYTIAGLTAGDYLVCFSADFDTVLSECYDDAPDWTTATILTLADDQAVAAIDAELAVGGSIHGSVTLPDDLGATVDIALYRADTDNPTPPYDDRVHVSTRSRDQWSPTEFSFTGLPDGDYFVQFQPRGGEYGYGTGDWSWPSGISQWFGGANAWTEAAPIQVEAGTQVTDIDADLTEWHRISGRLVNQITKDPIAESGVNLHAWVGTDQDPVYLQHWVRTADAGEYTFPPLPPGQYALSMSGDLQHDGGWHPDGVDDPAAATPVEVNGSDVTNLESELVGTRALVAGVARSKATGEPLEGACYALVPQGETGTSSGCARVGADGQGRRYVNEPGTYQLLVRSPDGGGHQDRWYPNAASQADAEVLSVTQNDIDRAAVLSDLDVTLPLATTTLTGVVTDTDGAPIAGVPVQDRSWPTRTAWTDSEGRYVLGVEPGAHQVLFSAPQDNNYRSDARAPEFYDDAASEDEAATVAVSAGQHVTGIDASLAEGASISGTITFDGLDADAGPPYIRSVSAIDSAGRGFGTFTATIRQYSDRRDYHIYGLPPGSYTLQFRASLPEQNAIKYFDNTFSADTATPVTVEAGQALSDVDMTFSLLTPLPPTGVTATPGGGAVEVTWESADGRGNPVDRYEVEVGPGGHLRTVYSQQWVRIDGLTNGVEHTARIRARTAAGWGDWSEPVPFTPIEPLVWPSAPTALVRDRALAVTWEAAG